MRHKILGQPTSQQSQLAISAATADIDNDQTDDLEPKPSIKKTEKIPRNFGDQLFVHYTHEKRFQPSKRDIHQVYDNVFKNTNAMNLKIIVGNRNRRDAKNELIHKRPKPSILKNKPIKSNYFKKIKISICSYSTYLFNFYFLERPRKKKKTSTSQTTTNQP